MFRALRYPSFDEAAALGGSVGERDAGWAQAGTYPSDALEAARRAGFEAGHAEGLAAGRAEATRAAELRLIEALPDALAALRQVAAEVDTVRQTSARDAYLLVRAVLRQMLPTLADQALGHEIAALVGEVLRSAPAPAIEVRLAPATQGVIERLCGPAPAGVSFVADPGLPEGSVACRWTDGAARFDGQRIKESVLAILDRRLAELGTASMIEPVSALETQSQGES